VNDLCFRSGGGVPLTVENKPGGRRDRLYSCEFALPKVTNGILAADWLGPPLESKDISIEGSQIPPLDGLSETGKISVHGT